MRAWWLRCTQWRVSTRVGILAVALVAYLLCAVLLPAASFGALRPLNLLMVVTAAIFFGMRLGVVIALADVVLNVTLYAFLGLLAETGSQLGGNLLSIVMGVALCAVVGRARDLTLELEAEANRREVAERRRAELTAHLVHDLKNPLAGIGGHAQLLQEDLAGTPHAESLQYIHSASERMARMVLNLLDVNRAEEGQLEPALQPLDLPALVEDVQRAMRPHLRDRQVSLEVIHLPGDGKVMADPDLMRRTLINLVENAIRYTPKKGAVRLELGGEGDAVELSVRDQGPGVPQGYEERIFEKYARLDKALPITGIANRGLGLHFCRLAVGAHGGRIWVEANEPAGSVFTGGLPRRTAAAA